LRQSASAALFPVRNRPAVNPQILKNFAELHSPATCPQSARHWYGRSAFSHIGLAYAETVYVCLSFSELGAYTVQR